MTPDPEIELRIYADGTEQHVEQIAAVLVQALARHPLTKNASAKADDLRGTVYVTFELNDEAMHQADLVIPDTDRSQAMSSRPTSDPHDADYERIETHRLLMDFLRKIRIDDLRLHPEEIASELLDNFEIHRRGPS